MLRSMVSSIEVQPLQAKAGFAQTFLYRTPLSNVKKEFYFCFIHYLKNILE
ncbi:hypothetical protein LEP1GSC125_0408 [Leptospira mayottensis 200901122]|uniref:Uncharacterized protein n=1 Tax=Leptospira mayottensis 200901122 TaxID=1193010 RepID=A0AA87MRR3_9LEPT|nr:hypothetical protein LEP1GSC125_0408 [Leptospira mayottensis 200901122]